MRPRTNLRRGETFDIIRSSPIISPSLQGDTRRAQCRVESEEEAIRRVESEEEAVRRVEPEEQAFERAVSGRVRLLNPMPSRLPASLPCTASFSPHSHLQPCTLHPLSSAMLYPLSSCAMNSPLASSAMHSPLVLSHALCTFVLRHVLSPCVFRHAPSACLQPCTLHCRLALSTWKRILLLQGERGSGNQPPGFRQDAARE